jgi:hypothetical protein
MAITRKYGVAQNHFWYALIAPPFPPLSPPSSFLRVMGAWYVNRYGNDKANTSFSAIIIVSRAVDFETFAGGVNPVDGGDFAAFPEPRHHRIQSRTT